MRLHLNKNLHLLTSFNKGLQWVKENTVAGGIAHSSSLKKPYPEVTGYYIPSLLNWGEEGLARTYADWLVSIQTADGFWQDVSLETSYTFDTGQILKGFYELINQDEKYEKAFLKGCDALLSQIDSDGRVHTPSDALFSSMGSEYIHLYAIEPLLKAGKLYNRSDYSDAAQRALNYYLSKSDLTDFNVLSHFHAYIIEALIDLDQKERALSALNEVKKNQRRSGAVPAFKKSRWVCNVAMIQYAICFYKLGMLGEGNRLLNYALKKQNPSGGFYGSSGWFAAYFKRDEIGWANKFLLDAIYHKVQLEFSEQDRYESYHEFINKSDGRYELLKSELSEYLESQALSDTEVKFVDVGAGKGRFIKNLMSDGFEMNITATDITDKLFKYLPEGIEKNVENISKINLKDATFDFVFCCEVLEHSLTYQAAVRELARICKPLGVVVIIDKSLDRNKNVQLESWEQWFDADELKALMESYGLSVKIKTVPTSDGDPITAWIGKK